MDYLSFLTIRHKNSLAYPCIDWQDYIILNSTANVDKALYPLGEYEKIHCLLDNDEAGVKPPKPYKRNTAGVCVMPHTCTADTRT